MNHRTTPPRHRRALALSVAVLLGLAACGDSNAVGSDELTAGLDDAAGDGLRLGETTTTTTVAAESTTAPPQTAAPQQTTAAPTTQAPTTTVAPQAAIEIKIQPDTASGQFDPRVVQVFIGSKVAWRNTDTVARSVVADNGAFDSGPIAPGAVWEFTTNQAGDFNYTDGTRPYAVGTLQVLP